MTAMTNLAIALTLLGIATLSLAGLFYLICEVINWRCDSEDFRIGSRDRNSDYDDDDTDSFR